MDNSAFGDDYGINDSFGIEKKKKILTNLNFLLALLQAFHSSNIAL